MRVQHNIASMNSYRNFNVNNNKMSKNLEKLSSGYAINRAGDDAAGLAVSEKMRWQTTGLDASIKNAKDGIGMIQTAEGALTEVHDMLNRMTYLAQQAANGTYATSDKANLYAEFDQLKTEITRIGSSTDFNGTKVLTGSISSVQLVVGTESADSLTLSDVNALDTQTSALTSINSTNAFASTSTVSTLKNVINNVSQMRATLGAYQNRLEHTINNLNVTKENITDAESRIRDTDVAEEMMKFTKNSIMNQAAQAMLAQANQLPQGVLQLLQ